jgi:tRNA(fMet)-specific endonuclease VapC
MLVLDTDILSHVFQGTPQVLQRLERAADSPFTTIINQIELLQARYAFVLKAADGQQLLRAQEWLGRTVTLLEQFPVLAIEQEAAKSFDSLLKIRGLRKIGRPDLLIASIALANQATLVTRNVKDFALVPGLVVENWVD